MVVAIIFSPTVVLTADFLADSILAGFELEQNWLNEKLNLLHFLLFLPLHLTLPKLFNIESFTLIHSSEMEENSARP